MGTEFGGILGGNVTSTQHVVAQCEEVQSTSKHPRHHHRLTILSTGRLGLAH